MKKYTSFVLVAIMSFVLVSCESVLTKTPLTKFTEDNFWTSEKNVQVYANYFYNTFAGYGKGSSNSTFYFPVLNDNQVGRSFVNWKSTSVDASNSIWNDCYTEIRRANIMLSHLPEIGLPAKTEAKWEGVARLYRAMQHYYLVRSFGDCYWVDKVLTPQDESVLYGERQDRDAVMDKVLEDLNFALANIPATTGRTEINQAVVQAVKSEICLYEGTFCKYRVAADNGKAADAARANKYLNESLSASAAIMGNSMYALNSDYQANYNSKDLAGNKEMIMYKKYETSLLTHGITDYTTSSTQMLGMSKAAFDSFLFKDGECLANTTCDKNDRATFTANGSNWKSDLKAVLATRDPRLSADIDDILIYQGTPGTPRIGTDGGCQETTSSSGYGVKKFDNLTMEWSHRNNGNSAYTDAPIYWLANIILNHAEASAELGNAADAIADINKLRQRPSVNMPTIAGEGAIKADPANNMGVSNLLWEVRRERRVELMYDNDDRYWSLIRWHQLDKLDMEKYPDIVAGAWVGTHVLATNPPKVDARGYITTIDKGVRKYESKQYLRPIPSGQIGYNPKIGQNPGW